MVRPFEEAMKFVFEIETDKFTNDPRDPGGPTKYGITLRTAIQYGLDEDKDGDVDIDDIKNMSPETAFIVYRDRYWNAVQADDLPWDIAMMAFDSAVNCGVGATKKLLIGWNNDVAPYSMFKEKRRVYYKQIVARKPELGVYINGWNNRVNNLDKLISMIRTDVNSGDSIVVGPHPGLPQIF